MEKNFGNFVPDRGDLIWVSFTPSKGHEQDGRRPAIVISPIIYNSKTGLCLVCPITSKTKNYPFEVKINNPKIKGVILSDHIKNIDYNSRNAEFISKVSTSTLSQIAAKLNLLLPKF